MVPFCGHLLGRRYDWLLLSQPVRQQVWQVSWEEGFKPLGNFSLLQGSVERKGGGGGWGGSKNMWAAKRKGCRPRQELNGNYSVLLLP